MAPERKESRKAIQMPILIVSRWILLLLWGLPAAVGCPPPCACRALKTFGLLVNCSNQGLTTVPDLPNTTRYLYLANNNLSYIPAGTFDHLSYIYEINVIGNPWHCDCKILYLKLWMEDYAWYNLNLIKCASPAVTATLSLNQLTGKELKGCRQLHHTTQYDVFLWGDLVLIVLTGLSIILLGAVLWMAKKTIYQVTLNQYTLEPQQWEKIRHQKSK